MTSALSWLGIGAAVCGFGSSVQAIEIVLVALPSWDVIAMVVVPGMLVAAVTTALAFVSVCSCCNCWNYCCSCWQFHRIARFQCSEISNAAAIYSQSTQRGVCALGCWCFPEVDVVKPNRSISYGFELEDLV